MHCPSRPQTRQLHQIQYSLTDWLLAFRSHPTATHWGQALERTEYCESVQVTQSMSKAGYPYDNAPMERYFNTLKNECTNLYAFQTEAELYEKVEEYAYVTYNHVRPHSYNNYQTPYQARKVG